MKVKDEISNPLMWKSNFNSKGRGFDRADLAFILKQQSPTKDQWSRINLELRVIVWPRHHEPLDPNLSQDFSSNPIRMEDVHNARKYAKTSIEMGAVLACVELRVRFPYETNDHLAYNHMFEPDDSTQKK